MGRGEDDWMGALVDEVDESENEYKNYGQCRYAVATQRTRAASYILDLHDKCEWVSGSQEL